MSFASPLLLWALALVAVPVAVHLILRARPRPVVFPALRLLRASLAQGERARRLRDRLLLAVRMSLIAMIVLALARPGCDAAAGIVGTGGPMACAIVVDDSVSMRYRPQFGTAETLLDVALDQARRWVEQTSELSSPAFAVMTASAPAAGRGLVSGRAEALARLAASNAPPKNARPLGAALTSAAHALTAASDAWRRIVVFTDGAASAWRDVSRTALGEVRDCDVDVVVVGPERPQDFRLSAAQPARVIAARAAAPFALRVIANGAGVLASVVASDLAGNVPVRVGPLALEPDSVADTTLCLPPRPVGVHGAVLTLEPPDLLDESQVQYVVWQTGPTPIVRLLVPAAPPVDDPTALLLASLLAPTGLPPEAQRVELVQGAALPRDAAVTLAIVLPGVELDGGALAHATALVEHGATLVLVPADTSAPPDWTGFRALLGEDAPVVETLDQPAAVAVPAAVAAGDALEELAKAGVRRRVTLAGLLPGVEVIARYNDGVPAIVERRIGRGRIILLATSPSPRWSDMGVRAAGLLAWLHARVDEAVGRPTGVLALVADETSHHHFETLPLEGMVTVVRETDGGAPPIWVRLREGRPTEPWPSQVAGVYAVQESGVVRARYAVNWPAEEFDLTRVTREVLVERLGTERVRVVSSTAELAPSSAGGFGLGLNTVAVVALLGLSLLVFESWLAATRGGHGAHAMR